MATYFKCTTELYAISTVDGSKAKLVHPDASLMEQHKTGNLRKYAVCMLQNARKKVQTNTIFYVDKC